jgi:DNA gyrase subunit B
MTNTKPKVYGDQSISTLKGADRVRKKPSVIFGSDGLEGCEHSFFEILSNSVDEAREGYGNEIKTRVFRDRSIEVDDRGRGVPLGYNEAEGRYNWELVYCELYAGGKYNKNEDNAAYSFSLGLNGLGACATQYSSRYMQVLSYKGDTVYEINFERGEPVSELLSRPLEKKQQRTGTTHKWLPDLDVFTDIAIPYEYYCDVLERQAVVNKGVRFILEFEEADGSFTKTEYFYKNGISDYIENITGGETITEPVYRSFETSGRDREDKAEYKFKAEFVFCISNKLSRIEYYHNSSYLEHGGAPDKAVRYAFVAAVDKQIKLTGKYTKNESKVMFADIEDCLVFIFNGFSTETSYENQTKKSITNIFIQKALTDVLVRDLEVYFAENPTEAEKFCAQVLLNKRSREAADKERVNIKKKLQSSTDVTNRVEKFVACRSKDPARRELYIVEGDSAMTSVKLARDAEFQAIIPVRGKTLNCLKSNYDKIFKSDIIVDLLRVIGCGVEINAKHSKNAPTFRIEDLKWSKIIICTDADEDGFQIRTLLLTLFYRLLPSLINLGKIFIAESPLFEIRAGDQTFFAYNEPEKSEIIATLTKAAPNKKINLQRSKGLGENEADMMALTTMNPATRRLVAIKPADAAETFTMFDTLLGDNLPARKVFISQNGARYAAQADV